MMRTEELMRSTYLLKGSNLTDYLIYAGEGIFRMSIGLESPTDILADITRILDRFV